MTQHKHQQSDMVGRFEFFFIQKYQKPIYKLDIKINCRYDF